MFSYIIFHKSKSQVPIFIKIVSTRTFVVSKTIRTYN